MSFDDVEMEVAKPNPLTNALKGIQKFSDGIDELEEYEDMLDDFDEM